MSLILEKTVTYTVAEVLEEIKHHKDRIKFLRKLLRDYRRKKRERG